MYLTADLQRSMYDARKENKVKIRESQQYLTAMEMKELRDLDEVDVLAFKISPAVLRLDDVFDFVANNKMTEYGTKKANTKGNVKAKWELLQNAVRLCVLAAAATDRIGIVLMLGETLDLNYQAFVVAIERVKGNNFADAMQSIFVDLAGSWTDLSYRGIVESTSPEVPDIEYIGKTAADLASKLGRLVTRIDENVADVNGVVQKFLLAAELKAGPAREQLIARLGEFQASIIDLHRNDILDNIETLNERAKQPGGPAVTKPKARVGVSEQSGQSAAVDLDLTGTSLAAKDPALKWTELAQKELAYSSDPSLKDRLRYDSETTIFVSETDGWQVDRDAPIPLDDEFYFQPPKGYTSDEVLTLGILEGDFQRVVVTLSSAIQFTGFKAAINSLVKRMMFSKGTSRDVLMFPFYLACSADNTSYTILPIHIHKEDGTLIYSPEAEQPESEFFALAHGTFMYLKNELSMDLYKAILKVLKDTTPTNHKNSLALASKKKTRSRKVLIYSNSFYLRSDGFFKADGVVSVKELLDFLASDLLFSPSYIIKDLAFDADYDIMKDEKKMEPGEIYDLADEISSTSREAAKILADQYETSKKGQSLSLIRMTNKGLAFAYPDKWKRLNRGAKISFEISAPRTAKKVFSDTLRERIADIKAETGMATSDIVDLLYDSPKHEGLKLRAISQSVKELKEREAFLPAYFTLMDLADLSSRDHVKRRGSELVISSIPEETDMKSFFMNLDPSLHEGAQEAGEHNRKLVAAQKALQLFNKSVGIEQMTQDSFRGVANRVNKKFRIKGPEYPSKPDQYLATKRGVETVAASEAVDAIEQTAKESIVSILKTSRVGSDRALGEKLDGIADKQTFVDVLEGGYTEGELKQKLSRFAAFLTVASSKRGGALTSATAKYMRPETVSFMNIKERKSRAPIARSGVFETVPGTLRKVAAPSKRVLRVMEPEEVKDDESVVEVFDVPRKKPKTGNEMEVETV